MISTPKEYTANIISTEYLSPKVIWLKLFSDEKVNFIPGQYLSLFTNNETQRLYSFANSNNHPYLELVIDISPNGPGSNYVKNLKINDTVRFLSPFGHFKLNLDSPFSFLFVATGTGIAPIRSHLQYLLENNISKPITLVFGNPDENHVLFHKEFLNISKNHNNFTYLPVCSNPSLSWSWNQGLVTDVLKNMSNPPGYDNYICGNSPMILSVMALLREQGVPDEQIHVENYT